MGTGGDSLPIERQMASKVRGLGENCFSICQGGGARVPLPSFTLLVPSAVSLCHQMCVLVHLSRV